MNIQKRLARKVIFPVITSLGLEKTLRNSAKNSTVNLMFHGVSKGDSSSFSPRHIEASQFERILQYLKKEFTIISLSEAFEIYRTGKRPEKKCVTVSFDDGYRNNLSNALPLLSKHGIKTTFFISGVCAEPMDIRVLWADIIACLKKFHQSDIIPFGEKKFVNFLEEPTGIHLDSYIKTMKPEDRTANLKSLISRFDLNNKLMSIPAEWWEILDKSELQELALSPLVEIASHGYDHYNLGDIGRAEAYADMEKSKVLLESAIGKKVDMIAYPDGSYTPEIKDDAAQIGFVKQLAVKYRYPEDRTDQRILNRYGVSATTTYHSNVFFINKAFKSMGFN
jgi:peptidoglycan/xylan/chitin deacetylase (PgdA/CDA1 family)